MKKILFIYLLFFLFEAKTVCSQVGADKKGLVKKEKALAKPPAYDSTKTFGEQYKLENQFQFIGLQLFLPPVINPESGPVVFSENNSGFGNGNKYYTIVDVLKGDIKKQLEQKNAINQCGSNYKDLNSSQWKELIIHVVFILRENKKNDSLNSEPLYWVVCESKQAPYACSNFSSFIPVPYYEKQKQLYKDQNVIDLSDKSKWLCKEVSLLKSWDSACRDTSYGIFCLLENEKGEKIQRRPPSDKSDRSFMTEKEYVRLDHANRNQKEQLIKAENDAREKRKAECAGKFGKRYGALIAQNKIEAGMTTEMCKAAWGSPWNISKTTSAAAKEIWFYNWKYNLHFENTVLVRIEQGK